MVVTAIDGVHTSVQSLENDIRDWTATWTATWNTSPRTFAWAKTADEILASFGDYITKIRTDNPATAQE